MSKNINTVVIAGRTTKDPEIKVTPSGTAVLSLSLAVNDTKKNAQGEWEDVVDFFDCKVFGKRAESLAQYIPKGSKLTINGRLHQDRWQAQDGTNRSRVSIIVQDIELPPRSQPQGTGEGYADYTQPPQPMQPVQPIQAAQSNRLIDVQTTVAAPKPAPQPIAQDSMYGDEIPF
ncbi:single-stranded DNA-binding protein [Fannyhessea vaginae]|jgi:single-strand binding protein|uniref:single-stranded DNA-binding protein n=1 Tax=Fannyhessea vaginae TaxID=82135 RepID=UPI002060E6F0|nr:single-stranded DNA-binding protein [Fannyhessea vaginae]DAK30252.1 MAG TPA: Single strand binding protein [Caudoviricetes sp.]DAR41757.1 MAG TPA: Single strand binding protein [Caudoviricetes sp.]